MPCKDLDEPIYQLAVMLYPRELMNEKILLKLRECIHGLNESQPLKRWLKNLGNIGNKSSAKIEKQDFLKSIINSGYNVLKAEDEIKELSKLLLDFPERNISEKILKSYLYLMIGNTARSDNILGSVIEKKPLENWMFDERIQDSYHKIANDHLEVILKKMSKHPSDRKVFNLFILYLKKFFNDPQLLQFLEDFDSSEIEANIHFRYYEQKAPKLTEYLKLARANQSERLIWLREKKNDQNFITYWILPFLDIHPLSSRSLLNSLEQVEEQDQLWFIYLMDDDHLFNLFFKKNKNKFLPNRRKFLSEQLDTPGKFMMSLYKLIEFGDVNDALVLRTLQYLHDN